MICFIGVCDFRGVLCYLFAFGCGEKKVASSGSHRDSLFGLYFPFFKGALDLCACVCLFGRHHQMSLRPGANFIDSPPPPGDESRFLFPAFTLSLCVLK